MTLSDEIVLDGPSREMDARIASAIGFGRVAQEWHYERLEWYAWKAKARTGPWEVLKPYTTSLDAAMTLVPEGWSVSLVRFPEGDAECGVLEFRPDEKGKLWHAKDWGDSGRVKAATPALALAAAAIRARTEEKGHG